MKKLIVYLAAAAAVLTCCVSCGSSSPQEDYVFPTPASESAVGTYAGEICRIEKADTTVAECVMEIAFKPNADSTGNLSNAVYLKFTAASISLDAGVTVNISHCGEGFIFTNTSAANELKNAITGSIDEEGLAVASFSMSQRTGRKSTTFNFVFTGLKQSEQ